jgi:hypothetical protein
MQDYCAGATKTWSMWNALQRVCGITGNLKDGAVSGNYTECWKPAFVSGVTVYLSETDGPGVEKREERSVWISKPASHLTNQPMMTQRKLMLWFIQSDNINEGKPSVTINPGAGFSSQLTDFSLCVAAHADWESKAVWRTVYHGRHTGKMEVFVRKKKENEKRVKEK